MASSRHEDRQRRLLRTLRLIVVLWAVGALLVLAADYPDRGLVRAVFNALGFFSPAASDWVFEPASKPGRPHVVPLLQVYVFLVPLVTFGAVVAIFWRAVERWLLVFAHGRLTSYGDHVVVVGLTPDSLGFADDLLTRHFAPPDGALRRRALWWEEGLRPLHRLLRHDRGGRRLPVVFASDPDDALLLEAARLSIPVRLGAVTDPEVLRAMRLNEADAVVSFLADVGEQIDLAIAVGQAMTGRPEPPHSKTEAKSGEGERSKRPQPKRLELWLRVDNAALAKRLDDYVQTAARASQITLRFFNLYELAARDLLRRHPPDLYADALGREQVHLAIYGFGSLGEHVLLEAVRQCQYLGTPALRITVLDSAPDAACHRFRALGIDIDRLEELRLADITFRKLDLELGGIGLADYVNIPEAVTLHVIAVPDDALALASAIALRRLLLQPPAGQDHDAARLRPLAPIVVRARDRYGLRRLCLSGVDGDVAAAAEEETPDGIFSFAPREDLVREAVLLNDERNRKLAAAVHRFYEDTLATSGTQGLDLTWSELTPTFLESNRQVADHLSVKVRAMRYRIERADEAAAPWSPSATQLEALAEVEHARWNAERLVAAWRWAPQRLDHVKAHPSIVPWSELSEGERKKDRDQVIRVPDILRAGGLTVRPEHVIGVFGDTDIDHDDDAWQSAVRNALGAEVEAARKLGRSPVVWTSLAPGAETIVAIVAKSLDYPVPYFVPLPLPIEAYHQVLRELDPDGVKELLATFRRLIAAPEAVASTARPRYVELPPRQLPLSKYGRKERHDADVVEALRQEQKLCAAAFIFERADQILFIGNIDGEITTRMRIWSGGKDLCDFERYRTPVCFAFKNPCGADGLRQVRLT